MSLFPAYAQQRDSDKSDSEEQYDDVDWRALVLPSPACESALLASDTDSDVRPRSPPAQPAPVPAPADFYVDRKLDRGNLRVSTLYFPGRPQYSPRETWLALGARAGVGGGGARRRVRRYYARGALAAATGDEADEAGVRAAAYRRALAAAPQDEELWLRFLDFQEWCGTPEDALAAAEQAAAGLPRSPALRARRLHALRRALSHADYLARLRTDLAAEGSEAARAELWARLVGALAGGAGDAGAVRRAAAAAVRATRHHAPAYPLLLHVYGAFLRSAGLWEDLVQLVELVVVMNCPPAAAAAARFPPSREDARDTAAEAQLRDYEDKVVRSGLPLSEVWVRVERARAALHWRPAAEVSGAELAADPQRAPHAHDAAALLLPVVGPAATLRLHVALLRLAEVPLLPAAGYVLRGIGGGDAAADWEAAGGAAMVALLRAARRLPPAHPAHVQPGQGAPLLAHVPHRLYHADTAGYGAWVSALWDACLAWAAPGAARQALLCWRLRHLHARALLAPSEAARLRGEAREALRRHAGDAALPYVVFARLEAAAAGSARGLRAALQAARAALHAPDTPPHDALYAARVVRELENGEGAAGSWALVCAVLRRQLPPELQAPPPSELAAEALRECEVRCDELERALEDDDGEDEDCLERACEALLPAAAEWGAARVALAPAPRRRELLAQLQAGAPAGQGWRRERYREQSACALAAEAAREHRTAQTARALQPLFPHNAYLALLCSGAPLWAWDAAGGGGAAQEARLRALRPARTAAGALAALLPALLEASARGWAASAARRVARGARRALRSGAGEAGSALLWALRLEAEARAPGPARAALLAALDAAPHAHWLHVRGAALVPSEAAALPDLLLDKQLRLHALPDELRPLSAPASGV